MKVLFLCVGKNSVSYFEEATDVYAKRLSHYCTFEMAFVPDVKNTKAFSEQTLRKMEGDAILKQIVSDDTLILLDNNGVEFSSMEFAEWLEKKSAQAVKRIVFVIGGAFGFSEAVYNRADGLFSLSRLTFSHQMIRPIFVEQLYRAMTIIKGEPYHHDSTLWQHKYNKMK